MHLTLKEFERTPDGFMLSGKIEPCNGDHRHMGEIIFDTPE